MTKQPTANGNVAASQAKTKKKEESSGGSLIGKLFKFSIVVVMLGIVLTEVMTPTEMMARWRGTHIYPPNVHNGDTMLSWFQTHKFAYRVPNSGKVDDFVANPQKYVLPPGQLWPAPPSWWRFEVNTIGWKLFCWYQKKTPQMVQDYEPLLYWYRIIQAGIMFAKAGVDPGVYPKLVQEVAAADAGNECKAKVARRIDLVYNLLHTGEEFPLLVDTVEWLCNESCVTPKTCNDIETKDNTFDQFIREIRNIAYLRYGEQENCREQHTHESCLLPLVGSAVHTKKFGSTKAVESMMTQLKMQPENVGTRWLLNIAHMTLGTWPDAVPKEFLVPPSVFKSEDDIGRFINVAGGLGLDTYSALGAAIADDFDGDGYVDVFHTGSAYDDQVYLMKNPGVPNEKFIESHKSTNLTGITGGCNAKQTDYNNDGIMDIFILRGGWVNVKQPNSLLRGNPDGTYTEVTLKAFDKISLQASHSAEWADFDHDGLLDIFVANENNNCELWHNLGNDRFEEIGRASGVSECGLTKGMQWGDFNNDGFPDIYISRYGQTNKLWVNNGKPNPFGRGWSFTEISASAGVQQPIMSFPCMVFDANQDGWLDIMVAGHLFEGPDAIHDVFMHESYWAHENIINKIWGSRDARLPRLYINNGDLTFTDISQNGLRRVLMTMAMNYGDLNNDGYPEIYMSTGQPDVRALQPNRMFLNVEGKEFRDITTSGGFGSLQKGHGVSFTDFDNDGDLDVTANIGGAWFGDYFHDAVFLNPGGHGNHWIKVKLEGVYENRLAIGARFNVTCEMENGTKRSFYGLVTAGASYGSNGLVAAHIGLAKSKKILGIEVYWPRANKIQYVTGDIPMDSLIYIKEGEPFQVRPVKTIEYDVEELIKHTSCSHHHKSDSYIQFDDKSDETAEDHHHAEGASCH